MSIEEVRERDFEDLRDAYLAARDAIEQAVTLITDGDIGSAYLVLGRAIRADEGAIEWSEVGP